MNAKEVADELNKHHYNMLKRQKEEGVLAYTAGKRLEDLKEASVVRSVQKSGDAVSATFTEFGEEVYEELEDVYG